MCSDVDARAVWLQVRDRDHAAGRPSGQRAAERPEAGLRNLQARRRRVGTAQGRPL